MRLPHPKHAETAAQASSGRSRRGCPAGQSPAARRSSSLRIAAFLALLTILLAAPLLSASDCIPIQEAGQHVGETKCVAGQVVRVKVGVKGVRFLDFCEDQTACPFTVVVFSHDLKDVGDIRRLEGRMIEIQGPVKLYDGRAEIILTRVSQISRGAALIPPLPKNFDVENRGHFSSGHLRPSKKPKKTKAVPNSTQTFGNEADVEEPQ